MDVPDEDTVAPLTVDRLDHLVLTVRDVAATVTFYERALGMEHRTFADGRNALHFGTSKLNLHVAGDEIAPHAATPAPGSADLCFVTARPIVEVAAHLERCDVPIEVGPVARVGALGDMHSVYVRDPDGNLVEIAQYDAAA